MPVPQTGIYLESTPTATLTTFSSVATNINAVLVFKDANDIFYQKQIPLKTTTNRASNGSGAIRLPSNVTLTAVSVYWTGEGSTPTQPGQCYVTLDINPGGAVSTNHQPFRVISNYLYSGMGLVWPSGRIQGWRDQPGMMVVRAGADPAAGAEVADTVPANATWMLYAIEVVLVTSGAAANRNTAFFIDDAGSTITRRQLLTDTTNQTATLTRTHGWYPGTDAVTTASVSITDTVTLLAKFPLTLPAGPLFSGCNLRTVTTNIQAGDDYGIARYWVEEWISGNP